MAAVAEVTRIFNRDSIKIFGHNPDITVESDSQQFIAFTAALASCTRDYTFTATFLSSATVWIEFDGEYIRIHGPNCIFSHDDTKPVFQVPKNWKGAYQTNPYEEVPIGAYTPDVSLEQSLKQSLLRRVENEQWSEAYRNFFELLPCITLPETLDVASKIQAQPPYGLSVKSTIAMGLFWLGLQTQKERSELAERSYLTGLKILEDIGAINDHPAIKIRVMAHLVNLYEQEKKQDQEIASRKKLISLLQPEDDAMRGQLDCLFNLAPDTSIEELGLENDLPEKTLSWLAAIYKREKKPDLEVKARVKQLRNYHQVVDPAVAGELRAIIEADPEFDPHSIFSDQLPKQTLKHLCATYVLNQNTTAEIKTRCLIISIYDGVQSTTVQDLDRLFQLDPTGAFYHQLAKTPEDRLAFAEHFMPIYAQGKSWSYAHKLAEQAFNENPQKFRLATLMLEYARLAEEAENTIKAHTHILRLIPEAFNIQAFLDDCNKLPTLPDAAYEQLKQLPACNNPERNSTFQLSAAKLLQEKFPEDAEKAAIASIHQNQKNLEAYKFYYFLMLQQNKRETAVSILSTYAQELYQPASDFKTCLWLLSFLKEQNASHPTLDFLFNVMPLMAQAREQQKENKKLRSELDTLAKELEAIKLKQQAAERSGYLSQLTSFLYSANKD